MKRVSLLVAFRDKEAGQLGSSLFTLRLARTAEGNGQSIALTQTSGLAGLPTGSTTEAEFTQGALATQETWRLWADTNALSSLPSSFLTAEGQLKPEVVEDIILLLHYQIDTTN